MPCIQTTTNIKIAPDQERALKEAFGKAIELIPGKSEDWLMVTFADGLPVYFKGDSAPAAFLAVKLFGKATASAYDALTERLTAIVGEELSIDPARVYIQYEETSHWGWNGSNL